MSANRRLVLDKVAGLVRVDAVMAHRSAYGDAMSGRAVLAAVGLPPASFGAAHRSAQPSTVFSATSFPLAFDHVTCTGRATRVATNPEDTADTRNSRSATFRQPERRRSQPERRRSDRRASPQRPQHARARRIGRNLHSQLSLKSTPPRACDRMAEQRNSPADPLGPSAAHARVFVRGEVCRASTDWSWSLVKLMMYYF